MNKVHGCAPVYFSGALIFLAGGGTFIYFEHIILGAILLVPGLALLVLSFITFLILFQLKRGDEVSLVVRDSEDFNEQRSSRKSHASQKQKKRKKRK